MACLPRDTSGTRNYRRRAVVEMPSPHRHRRGATALFRNPVRGAKRMRAGILRILQISRAGGTPPPMAGRLTQLAKIYSLDLYNRSSAVDSSSATDPRLACLPGAIIIQPAFGGCLHLRIAIPVDKNRSSAVACAVTPAMPIKRKRPSDCSKGRFVRGRLPTLPGYQYHRRGGA